METWLESLVNLEVLRHLAGCSSSWADAHGEFGNGFQVVDVFTEPAATCSHKRYCASTQRLQNTEAQLSSDWCSIHPSEDKSPTHASEALHYRPIILLGSFFSPSTRTTCIFTLAEIMLYTFRHKHEEFLTSSGAMKNVLRLALSERTMSHFRWAMRERTMHRRERYCKSEERSDPPRVVGPFFSTPQSLTCVPATF